MSGLSPLLGLLANAYLDLYALGQGFCLRRRGKWLLGDDSPARLQKWQLLERLHDRNKDVEIKREDGADHIAVARKIAVQPFILCELNMPYKTTSPEAIPIRLMITCSSVKACMDRPKIMAALIAGACEESSSWTSERQWSRCR